MRYRRKEPFRYIFNEPIDGSFVIVLNPQDQEKIKRSDPGYLKIIELSPKGMQFKTNFDIPTSKIDFLLDISFEIDGETMQMLGEVAWKKSQKDSMLYGLKGIDDLNREQQIIERVKLLSKKAHEKMHQLKEKNANQNDLEVEKSETNSAAKLDEEGNDIKKDEHNL